MRDDFIQMSLFKKSSNRFAIEHKEPYNP